MPFQDCRRQRWLPGQPPTASQESVRGTSRGRDPSTSENFRGQEDGKEPGDSMSKGEERGMRGEVGREKGGGQREEAAHLPGKQLITPGLSWPDGPSWEGELSNGNDVTGLPPAKMVTGATSDDVTGKCCGGTSRGRDPATSENFRGQEDAEEPEQGDTVSKGEERGGAERLEQEKRGNVREEEDAKE
ncbi:hypothetical protein NDU88_000920 [Pleurodeles waltl]|uniref:Uncharacterized protein n=1 Tax=Pleurodeles waltl TaxID=8319 RepID=A0AAV7S8L9_PLEWA|nr:hypothetical protein NDU88_000920 [Pleurodeles waltl]